MPPYAAQFHQGMRHEPAATSDLRRPVRRVRVAVQGDGSVDGSGPGVFENSGAARKGCRMEFRGQACAGDRRRHGDRARHRRRAGRARRRGDDHRARPRAARSGRGCYGRVCTRYGWTSRTKASVRDGIAEAARARGPVTICIGNAGIAESAPFHRETLDHWRRTIGDQSRRRVPDLSGPRSRRCPRDQPARMIAISSIAGLRGLRNAIAYTASKHAVENPPRLDPRAQRGIHGRARDLQRHLPGLCGLRPSWTGTQRRSRN